MKFQQALNETAATATVDIVGTKNPHTVDWSSGNGPETDLGKRELEKRKKKKIVRRQMPYSSKMN